MQSVQYIAKPIITARDAIASHVRWKITLLMAARMREPLSPRATHSIQHHDECAIRRWLLSRSTLSLRGTPEYQIVLDRHAAFHREMQTVSTLLHSGEYGQAEHVLTHRGSFEQASIALANAIMALDRVPLSIAS